MSSGTCSSSKGLHIGAKKLMEHRLPARLVGPPLGVWKSRASHLGRGLEPAPWWLRLEAVRFLGLKQKGFTSDYPHDSTERSSVRPNHLLGCSYKTGP
jgi:hypothetical protein